MVKSKRSILKLFMFILLCLGIQNANAQSAVVTTPESGNGMTVLIVIVGILVLAFLYLFLKSHGYFTTKEVGKTAEMQKATVPDVVQDGLPGEVVAAIVMALHLYSSEIHDQEDPVITMIRVSRTYSPWSSKIYGLRKLPR